MINPSPPLFPLPQMITIFSDVANLDVNQSVNDLLALSINAEESIGSFAIVNASHSWVCFAVYNGIIFLTKNTESTESLSDLLLPELLTIYFTKNNIERANDRD